MLVTNNNVDLIEPLASFSIKEIIMEPVTKIVEGEADYELFLDKRLLNREVYLSVTSVFEKRHLTFWRFQHGEKIICKHNRISYWLYSFAKQLI